MLFDFVLALIIAYYFIKDSEFFRDKALSLISKKHRNSFITGGREVSNIMDDFFQGQLLTALIIGTIETAGLFIIKVKFAIVLGVIGGLLNIIPYFGPIFSAFPAVAIALIDSPSKALWTVFMFIIVQQLDNALISPKIVESKLGLHPVTTIIAVLVGGEFFGILGLFIAVPVMAILKVIFKKVIEEIV
jgi:predicted PurR-regulated permease PerM